jgi:hypothetical protein
MQALVAVLHSKQQMLPKQIEQREAWLAEALRMQAANEDKLHALTAEQLRLRVAM